MSWRKQDDLVKYTFHIVDVFSSTRFGDKRDFGGTAYRLSIRQGVSMGRRSEMEAEARKSGGVVTSVSVGGATAYIASGEFEVPPSALVS